MQHAFEPGTAAYLAADAELYLYGWTVLPAGTRVVVVGMFNGNVVVRRGDTRLTLPGWVLRRDRG